MRSSFLHVNYSAKPSLWTGTILFSMINYDLNISKNLFVKHRLFLYDFDFFRRTPETRQKAKEDIKSRTLSTDQDLPQLFLCPEGTNTNRRVLIQFKVRYFI